MIALKPQFPLTPYCPTSGQTDKSPGAPLLAQAGSSNHINPCSHPHPVPQLPLTTQASLLSFSALSSYI